MIRGGDGSPPRVTSVLRPVLVGICVLAYSITGCGNENAETVTPAQTVAALVDSISREYQSRVLDFAYIPREAAFVGEHGRVLVLDTSDPYLRLFTGDGDPLWQGSPPNVDGLEAVPEAIAAFGDDVVVLQPGFASYWSLAGDTLALRRQIALPKGDLPLGAIRACGDDGWILYLRDPNMPMDVAALGEEPKPGAPEVRPMGDPELRAAWIYPLAEWDAGVRGHAGNLLSRFDSSIVMLHRPSLRRGGVYTEFDCTGGAGRTVTENALVTGSGYPVQITRGRALQWSAGVAAVADGFVLALHRWFTPGFHDVDRFFYETEIIRLSAGAFVGSILIPGQWLLMDYRGDRGLLLTMSEPIPHFVVLPDSLISPANLTSQHQ